MTCTVCAKPLGRNNKTGLCRNHWALKSLDRHRCNPNPALPTAVVRERKQARYRRKYLPVQLEAARRKVVMLEREAARLGVEI